ncbi:retrovirus-related pol polyprotein from transposon TNT 1-94 [Tanacetum coccineum]
MTTIRLVLSIVAVEDLHLEKLDVKTDFLHGDLDEFICMTQPEGFQSAGKEENLRTGYERCAMDHLFEMKDRCSEKQVLDYVFTVGVTTVEWESRLQKSIAIYTKSLIHLAKISKGSLSLLKILGYKETCIDVHQVGDEREVKVLRSFNWPPSELITEDGFLPERGYSQFNDVSSGYLVSKVS